MPKKHFTLVALLLLFLINACTVSRLNKNPEFLYNQAVASAAYPEKSKIATNLLAVSKTTPNLQWKTIEGEEYILVSTWTSEQNTKYYPASGTYNTSNYPIWVTLNPQLKERYLSFKMNKKEDPSPRLKQLLGLPPNVNKTHFVEFWVKPTDLFRPCPDNEITDNSCGLCFPENTSEAYRQWVNQLRLDSYYNCKGDKYPWTQLGYTYDWNPKNKSHVGLSEFVIKQNSTIYVNKIAKTLEYLSEK